MGLIIVYEKSCLSFGPIWRMVQNKYNLFLFSFLHALRLCATLWVVTDLLPCLYIQILAWPGGPLIFFLVISSPPLLVFANFFGFTLLNPDLFYCLICMHVVNARTERQTYIIEGVEKEWFDLILIFCFSFFIPFFIISRREMEVVARQRWPIVGQVPIWQTKWLSVMSWLVCSWTTSR